MSQRRGGLPLFEAEHGRVPGRCRECGSFVPRGRVWWCSDDCVQAHELRSNPSAQRLAVFNRDRGVCDECGRDCVELRGKLRPLLKQEGAAITIYQAYYRNGLGIPESIAEQFGADAAFRLQQACDLVHELGLLKHLQHRDTFWDMDHRLPLWEGGTNAISNLRTLCIPCHREATRVGAKRRALARGGQA